MKKSLSLLSLLLSVLAGVAMLPTQLQISAQSVYPNVSSELSPKEMFRVYNGVDGLSAESPYRPENRLWAGVPNIEVTGKRIWAAIYTGGVKEPDPDGLNHSVVAVSDDGGETWVDPYIVNDDPNMPTYMTTPWLAPDGRLFMFIESYGGYAYSVYTESPEAPLDQIEWHFTQENADGTISGMFSPEYLPYNHKPIAIQNSTGKEEWLFPTRNWQQLSGGGSTNRVGIWVSTDQGKSWELRSVINNPEEIAANVTIPEPTLVELGDGRIMLLSRIERGKNGGMMRCYSSNGGKSWTDWEYDLEEPFRGPGSLFNITELPSGNYLMVNNDNTGARTGLTAYLSKDGGKTFPYSLLIDRRSSSYPDVAFDEEGRIYIINDAMRYTHNEIRMTIVTEQDIINGSYSNESTHNLCVFRTSGRDIVSVNFENKLTYDVGTPIETILANLPQTIEYVASDGAVGNAEGVWNNLRYWKDTAGIYEFYFESEDIDSDIQDIHNYLTAYVTLRETNTGSSGGCGSTIAANLAAGSVCILPAAGFILKKGRKKNDEI